MSKRSNSNYIVIGGDFVPTDTNSDLFRTVDSKELLGNALLDVLLNADFRIFNLEVPLVDKETPMEKNGPNLIARTSAIDMFKSIGVDAFTLGNNHIMDQGIEGLESTLNVLTRNDIRSFGAGRNLNEARVPLLFSFCERKIGVYACTEHEFSIAEDDAPGANPFDVLESFQDISRLKSETEYVIVLYHGGKERYRFPSPLLQKTCRKIIEYGADLVICQHSHCIGCEEKYKGKTIVYGQGNFLFDRSNEETWQTGLVILLNNEFEIEYLPIKKTNNVIRLADEKESESIMLGFEKRSEQIKDDLLVEKEYEKMCSAVIDDYLWEISGASNSILCRIINRLSGYKFVHVFNSRVYNKKRRLALRNYFECEAHRELIVRGLKSYETRTSR